ncbi:MAG TPA: hypothetical protein VMF88_12515 [Bacteroidota bacterium]|nr:hypothetical protein [Bacteroidota bacterium]
MKTLSILLATGLFGLLCGCLPQKETNQTTTTLAALEIVPHPDTLNMAVNATQTLSLRGTTVDSTQQTSTNSGILTETGFTSTSVDTNTTPFPSDQATWTSSNTGVATVSNGVVTAHGAGYSSISATAGGATAPSVLVSVQTGNSAPGLSLDPPEYSVIFRDTVSVSGNVQQHAILLLSEASSGYNNTNVPYDGNGNFSETIIGLQTGFRTIVATAENSSQTGLATTRYKYVVYYQYLSPAADSICGNWVGTTLSMNFNFNISKSIVYSRYDINGHIDIQFPGIGFVRNITLTGIIASDGTINATLTQTSQGFTISGYLKGYFMTVGTGAGSYRASAKKTGWPTLSATADWTAVKQ